MYINFLSTISIHKTFQLLFNRVRCQQNLGRKVFAFLNGLARKRDIFLGFDNRFLHLCQRIKREQNFGVYNFINNIGHRGLSISELSSGKHDIFNKYKTFSVLIYSYINTSGNWENEKLCGNTTPEGRSVFTQFRVYPISTSVDITVYQYGKNVLYLFYSIAQRNIKK